MLKYNAKLLKRLASDLDLRTFVYHVFYELRSGFLITKKEFSITIK